MFDSEMSESEVDSDSPEARTKITIQELYGNRCVFCLTRPPQEGMRCHYILGAFHEGLDLVSIEPSF